MLHNTKNNRCLLNVCVHRYCEPPSLPRQWQFGAVFSAVLIIALQGVVLSAVEPTTKDDMTIAEMILEWNKRQMDCKTVHATWREVTTAPETARASVARTSQSVNELLLGPDTKVRHEHRPPTRSERASGHPFMLRAFTSAYNGLRNRNLTLPATADDWPRGISWNAPEYDELVNYHLRALLLHFRPLNPGLPGLGEGQYEITSYDTVFQERPCVIITSIETDPQMPTNRYWIDTERGCSILRHTQTVGGVVTAELSITYESHPVIGWAPQAWEALFTNGSLTTHGEVLDLKVNENIPPKVFDLTFPPGTIEFDRDDGHRYLLLSDGSRRQITAEESARGFAYGDLFTSASGDLASPPLSRRNPALFIVVVVNVVAIGGGIFYLVLWRWRRHQRRL